jgi:hypothetical protein
MIIKPADAIAPLQSGANVYYNDSGIPCVDIIKRVSLNPETNVGRLEKITFGFDPHGYHNVVKECATGPIENNKLLLENYSYVTTDMDSGEYLQSGGYSQFPSFGDIDSYVDYGYNDVDVYPNLNLFGTGFKKKINNTLEFTNFNMDNLNAEVILFENKYQLPYTETIGFLNAFFSTWTFSYPIECTIVIDCVRKLFNIPKVKYLPGINKEEMKMLYATLVTEVDLVSNYIFRVLERERRQLKKIIAFIHPFGTMIKLKDMNMATDEKYNIYNPCQVQTFMRNVKTDGLKYLSSESLGILREGVNGEAVKNALECCDIFF